MSPVELTNRHPVDELADLRHDISRLEGRVDFLRRTILAGDCSLVGEEHRATIRLTERRNINMAALKLELGDRLDSFMFSKTVESVTVAKRKPGDSDAPPEAVGEDLAADDF